MARSGVCLKDQFPCLDCKVNERCVLDNGSWRGNWRWRVNPRGRTIDDIPELGSTISNITFSCEQPDFWNWTLDPHGVFSVNKFSSLIHSQVNADLVSCPDFT